MINEERNKLISRFLSEIKRRGLSRIQWYMLNPRTFSLSSLNYFLSHYPQHERTMSTVSGAIAEWLEESHE